MSPASARPSTKRTRPEAAGTRGPGAGAADVKARWSGRATRPGGATTRVVPLGRTSDEQPRMRSGRPASRSSTEPVRRPVALRPSARATMSPHRPSSRPSRRPRGIRTPGTVTSPTAVARNARSFLARGPGAKHVDAQPSGSHRARQHDLPISRDPPLDREPVRAVDPHPSRKAILRGPGRQRDRPNRGARAARATRSRAAARATRRPPRRWRGRHRMRTRRGGRERPRTARPS